MPDIDDSKHFATVPKHEYEELLRVYNDKKDISINIQLSLARPMGYSDVYMERLTMVSADYNFYPGHVDPAIEKLYSNLNKIIDKTIEQTEFRKNIEIKIFVDKLAQIKSKWWFKLFAPKYMQL